MMIGYGQYTVHSGVFTGKLSELNQEDEQGMMDYAFNYTIVPGAAYTLWTVIKNDSGTYTTDDIQVTEFTLDDVQEGGSAQITFGAPTVVDYTSIEIPFTRPDNAYAVYIMFVSDAAAYRTERGGPYNIAPKNYITLFKEVDYRMQSLPFLMMSRGLLRRPSSQLMTTSPISSS